MSELSRSLILDQLKYVHDPELGKDLVSLGMIKDIEINGGEVVVTVELTTPACPLKKSFRTEIISKIQSLPGVGKVSVNFTHNVRKVSPEKENLLPGVKNTIAVASGKGGVGKSTVAVNIAVALAQTGAKTGLLDCDIYGPSVPLMMDMKNQKPVIRNSKIEPLENYGVKMMSIGFFIEEDDAVIWRGPMVMKAVDQFLRDVDWGKLDYLVVDLPPGTGDAQLTLIQTIPLSGAVIVTTPQDIALVDARKAITMFQKMKVHVLGIVENMSYFICPHCSGRTDIFLNGGAEKVAKKLGIELIGRIPIDRSICEYGDRGVPVVTKSGELSSSKAFEEIAGKLAAELSIISYKEKEDTRLAT